jgi:hypothetical protein
VPSQQRRVLLAKDELPPTDVLNNAALMKSANRQQRLHRDCPQCGAPLRTLDADEDRMFACDECQEVMILPVEARVWNKDKLN